MQSIPQAVSSVFTHGSVLWHMQLRLGSVVVPTIVSVKVGGRESFPRTVPRWAAVPADVSNVSTCSASRFSASFFIVGSTGIGDGTRLQAEYTWKPDERNTF